MPATVLTPLKYFGVRMPATIASTSLSTLLNAHLGFGIVSSTPFWVVPSQDSHGVPRSSVTGPVAWADADGAASRVAAATPAPALMSFRNRRREVSWRVIVRLLRSWPRRNIVGARLGQPQPPVRETGAGDE